MATEGNNTFLPNDIITNILQRLPVKSLIRFQSVCKDWKNLFKTPSFIADHLHHSHHNNLFLVLKRYCTDIYFLNNELDILKVHKPPLMISSELVKIVGSTNGLLLVRVLVTGFKRALLLWNPAIRQVRHVSGIKKHARGHQIFGFGFSPMTKDYTILRLCWDFLGGVNRVEVYSLSTSSWKEVGFGIIQSVRHSCTFDIVSTNGTMFWFAEEDDRIVVVSFDIAMNMFKLISMPTSTCKSQYKRLTIYENKLAMFRYHHRVENSQFSFVDLWVMEEDIGASGKSWSWIKKYAIGPISDMLYPICIWKNDIVCLITSSSEDQKHTKNSLFDLTTNKLKRFSNFSFRCDFYSDIFHYVESLVPVCNTNNE